MTQRAPAIVSFLLFLLLCASIAYWLLLWLAPEPRPVAAPPQAERTLPPVTAAANLFGGQPQAGMANVQLRGIIHAGRAEGSVAIIAAEDKPTRALRVGAEVLPGLTVKEINARTVVLSERGLEKELSLPPFSAQEGGGAGLQVEAPQAPPEQAPQQLPQQAPQQATPAPPPQLPQPAASGPSSQGATASGGGTAGTGAAGAGNAANAASGMAPGTVPSTAPAQRPASPPQGRQPGQQPQPQLAPAQPVPQPR